MLSSQTVEIRSQAERVALIFKRLSMDREGLNQILLAVFVFQLIKSDFRFLCRQDRKVDMARGGPLSVDRYLVWLRFAHLP